MICVYPADCTDFSTNGNGTLAPLSAEVTETLNGEYELTLVHPIDEAGKWQRLVEVFVAPGKRAGRPRKHPPRSGACRHARDGEAPFEEIQIPA